jgi:hypothetical protein
MTIFVDKCYNNIRKHRLYVRNGLSENPCGFRLWKENKFPIDKFVFNSKLEAEEACRLLQEYVSNPDNMNERRERKKEKYVETKRTIFG